MKVGQSKIHRFGWCLIAVLSAPVLAHAQDAAPLSSDRPGFSTGTDTVAPGRQQIEAGLTANRQGDARSYSFGEPLLRFGLDKKTELRLTAPSYLRARGAGNDAAGFGDGSIGFKHQLAAGSSEYGLKSPAVSILGAVNLPLGSRDFRSGGVQPTINLLLNNNLSPRSSLTTNFNYSYLKDSARYQEFDASASFNFALSERVGSFVEVYGLFPSGGRDNTQFVDGGLTYLVNSELQVDFSLGFGLGNEVGGPDFFTGAGLTHRF